MKTGRIWHVNSDSILILCFETWTNTVTDFVLLAGLYRLSYSSQYGIGVSISVGIAQSF